MSSFDALDRKILQVLDSAGRLGVSDLARAVRHGRDTVAYRLRRLAEDGTMLGVEPVIDPAVLGLGLYKTYVSFAQADKALDRVHRRLRAHPQVYCAARAHGRWDLLFNVAAESAGGYAEVRNSLLRGCESEVRELGFAVFTQMTYFNRKYLGGAVHRWGTLAASQALLIDAIDRRILQALAEDAGRSDVQLADGAKVTPTVFRYRLRRLEASGVILGYRARFDRSAFQLSSFKLHIALRDYSERTLQEIERFAEQHPYIAQFMVQLGSWPCELNVEAHDNRHLTEIIDTLRSALQERIGLVEVTLYDRDEFTWGFGSKGAADGLLNVANAL